MGSSIEDVRKKSEFSDLPSHVCPVKLNFIENNNRCQYFLGVFLDPAPPGKPNVLYGWPLIYIFNNTGADNP